MEGDGVVVGGRQKGPPPSRLQKKASSDRVAVLDLIFFKSFPRDQTWDRAQELCGSRGGSPGLLVPNSPDHGPRYIYI